ncbi:hypothetical protein PG991_009507 [Apiospora marii]|uniref:Uncharacterized protein n=1 Tax=Apiospora marii TaxID=335849 RepID=A0ABR1RK53_9PEZI
MTQRRENLLFEEIADKYRIFILENSVRPREVVYNKEKQVVYVPRVGGELAAPGKIEVVSVRAGPAPPMTSIQNRERVWIDAEKRKLQHFEPPSSSIYRPATSGNTIEEVDLASGMIVGRVTADFYATPGDAASGLLQFSGQSAANCDRVEGVLPRVD